MSAPAWIVWDWNGTLLNDTDAARAAFNAQLRARGLTPVTADFYRAHFAFPVKPFYALCGVDLAHEDWERLARDYHAAYQREPKALNDEARAALARVQAAGVRQAVLSALRQDLLEAALAEYDLADTFAFVYGTDNLDGGSKLARGRELAARLGGERVVLIGDAVHDADVAAALGFDCILCAQGGHSAERLRRAAPTAATLLEAIERALTA